MLIHEETLLAETVNGLSWVSVLEGWEPEVAPGEQQGAELCGLGRDSSQWFWKGFGWAQPCHVTVFGEHPTAIVLPASLAGAW